MRYNIATMIRGGYAMQYLSVSKIAEKWNISPCSVRNYCAEGRASEAFLSGKTWSIPACVEKPDRVKRKDAAPPNTAGYFERGTVRKADRWNLP